MSSIRILPMINAASTEGSQGEVNGYLHTTGQSLILLKNSSLCVSEPSDNQPLMYRVQARPHSGTGGYVHMDLCVNVPNMNWLPKLPKVQGAWEKSTSMCHT